MCKSLSLTFTSYIMRLADAAAQCDTTRRANSSLRGLLRFPCYNKVVLAKGRRTYRCLRAISGSPHSQCIHHIYCPVGMDDAQVQDIWVAIAVQSVLRSDNAAHEAKTTFSMKRAHRAHMEPKRVQWFKRNFAIAGRVAIIMERAHHALDALCSAFNLTLEQIRWQYWIHIKQT